MNPLTHASLRLCAAIFFAAPFVNYALAQQDAPPLDAMQVLGELDQAEARQAASARARRMKLQGTLQQGAAGGSAAANLYEDAIRATRFAGKDKQAAEFAEWKKANGDLLRSPRMQDAIRLHLRHLALGLQQSSGETAAQMPALFLQHARDLAEYLTDKPTTPDPREASDLLQRPAREGIVVRWLAMGDLLPKDEEWEAAAGNVDGILEKNVRAPWRKEKDPKIMAAWDLQIGLLDKRAQSAALTIESDNLQKIARPRLVFARANDKILLGQTNSGQKDILLIIREYPQHPDWPQWVARLRTLLGGAGNEPREQAP